MTEEEIVGRGWNEGINGHLSGLTLFFFSLLFGRQVSDRCWVRAAMCVSGCEFVSGS